MQSLNERLASLAIRGEKMKEKRLMTDVGTISSGEDLLGSEEISFLTSSDVTGLNHHWPLWRRGPEGQRSARSAYLLIIMYALEYVFL